VPGDSIIGVGIPRATTLRLSANLCWSPGKEVGEPKGIQSREGGTLSWVVQAEGNEILLSWNFLEFGTLI
jgi:hypothetical protein